MAFCKLIGAASLLSVIGTFAIAQEQDPGRQILEEQQRRERMQELQRGQTGQQVTTPDVQGVVRETPCFPIDHIELTGVTIFKPGQLQSIAAEFSGKCLGQISINNLLKRISAAYADRGYITTRAYIPAQDIATRKLRIDVLEGRIEAFVYRQVDKDGKPRNSPKRKITTAFPAKAGEVLQLREIEHGLEQINRLASSQANANLSAGQAPGTSQVVVTEQKIDPVRGSIAIDNQGTEDTGETRISFSVEADDLMRINDTVSLSYSGTENSNAFALSASLPYRRWLFSGYASYSESLSNLSSTADLFTQSAYVDLRAERLMYRNARSKYYAYAGISSYWNERFVNIAALTPQHRTAYRIGFRHEHRLEKAIIAADTSLSFGADFFGADRDPARPATGAPRTEYSKLQTRIDYIRPFENGNQLSLSFTGQIADQPLYSNEQISIGGWNSVRGYKGFDVAGDTGFFLHSEYRFKAHALDIRNWGKPFGHDSRFNPFKEAEGATNAYVFVDFGHVYSKARSEAEEMLSIGAGAAMRLGKTTLRGALAVPLIEANGQERGEVQALLKLTVKAF